MAIKVLPAGFSADPERLLRFELEARAVAALNHPNILAIYDVGTHEGQPFLVSELLEGETLHQKLAHGTIPIRRALEYAAQIASGLGAAHAKGIVHRDLKPSNLFVTSEGRAKILDFGLAKLIGPGPGVERWSSADTGQLATRSGVIVGTVSYMSPEQVRGEKVDHRSDIFSFGLVVYELLTGRRAFDRPSPIETMNAAVNDEPAGFADAILNLPVEIEPILRRCLEKSPEDRFQSARDLAFQLTTVLNGLAPRVKRTALDEPRPFDRRSLVLGVVGIALALGLGFLGGMRADRVTPPTYQQLTFRRGSVSSARFAFDGHTIVYGAAWDNKPIRLSSTRIESPESRELDVGDADILAISSTGEMAISLGHRSAPGVAARNTLARLPLDASAPREILTDVEGADWSPDGGSLAVVHVVKGNHRLEFPIDTVLYETVGWISHVRVSPDGEQVAFIDHPVDEDDRGSVSVIRSAGGGKQVLSDGWSSVTGLAWSAAGDEIWFTAAEVGATASLYAVDLSGRVRVIMRSASRLAIQDIDRGGRVLLTESTFRLRIGAVDATRGNDKERDLSWLDGSVVTDLSADGDTLVINEQGAGGRTPLYAVYIRKTDGSPAVRIGEGSLPALSPDGRLVAALVLGSSPSVTLLPTGAGQPRTLDRGGLVGYQAVTWFPDGRRVLLAGNEAGRGVRLWAQEVPDGKPQPVSPEGLRIASASQPISPDGTQVAALDQSGSVWLHPLNGGTSSRLVDGLEPGDIPIRWSTDGQSFHVFRYGELPAIVHRFHLRDRRKDQVAVLTPSDLAGVKALTTVQTTPDGRLFLYTYSQTLSDLFLVTNVR